MYALYYISLKKINGFDRPGPMFTITRLEIVHKTTTWTQRMTYRDFTRRSPLFGMRERERGSVEKHCISHVDHVRLLSLKNI